MSIFKKISFAIPLILLSSCSFFGFEKSVDKQLFFPKNLLVYQQINLNPDGEFGVLETNYPQIETVKSAIVSILSKEDQKIDEKTSQKIVSALMEGEYALGIDLNIDSDSNTAEAPFLLHINLNDSSALNEIVEILSRRAEENINISESTETHQGFKLISFKRNNVIPGKRNEIIAYTKLNSNELLIAESKTSLVAAIERSSNPANSLKENEDFRSVNSEENSKKIAFWFINNEKYKEFTLKQAENLADVNNSALINQPIFNIKRSKFFTASVDEKGIKISRYDIKGDVIEDSSPLSGDLLKFINKDSVFWIYGSGIGDTLEDIYQAIIVDEASKSLFESFERAGNINIETDIISWLKGEFALSVQPPQLYPKLAPVNIALFIKNGESEATLQSWKKLEPLFIALFQIIESKNPILSIGGAEEFSDYTSDNNGNTSFVKSLELGNKIGDISILYGLFSEEDVFFITSSINSLNSIIDSKEQNSIENNNYFIESNLPSSYSSIFGFNSKYLLDLAGGQIDSFFFSGEIPVEYKEQIKPHLGDFEYVLGFDSPQMKESGLINIFIKK